MAGKPKTITAAEAASLVKSGSTIGITTFGMLLYPDDLVSALEKRFLATGEPGGINVVESSRRGQGSAHGVGEVRS